MLFARIIRSVVAHSLEENTKPISSHRNKRAISNLRAKLWRAHVGRIQTGLDKVLPLGLGYQWLELRGGECVDVASFRGDEQQNLSASQRGQLVGLDNNK